MEKEFIRVRSVKDIAISVSLIISGAVLLVLPTGTGVNITGFFLIFTGLILAMVLRTAYKDIQTGETYIFKDLYFDREMQQSILDAIATRPDKTDISQKDKGTALKLDIYFSKNTGKAYLQLFSYVPYKYEPCSKLYEYKFSDITNLIK